ncbi:hypothetical protein [Flammeovirga sp. EKP202]|uniref:hypothetical protein n=1 Tax=Flammeovirga sp. EKP202 TaxID=2770592 RepID=UPI00165F754C|nr:hypothetical protein [Flammeovirga sp. EKP202]MBD0402329.1 hypothetical protein [Flammeovirga sp. EKP202]
MKKIRIYHIPPFVEKIVLTISFLLVAIGSFSENFGISEFLENTFIVGGFVILLAYQSRVWWFKNYVEWNTKQIFLKLGNNKGLKLRFNTLNSCILQKDTLLIKLKNGETISIAIKEYNRKEVQELQLLLMENIIDKL